MYQAALPKRAAVFSLAPAMLLLLALAGLAMAVASLPWLQERALGALLLALLLGLLLGNSLLNTKNSAQLAAGCHVARSRLLRLGVVLYGVRLSWHDFALVGWPGLLVDAGVVASTFGLACWLGRRMGLSSEQRMLIGAGSAICGAAAVLASSPVVRAREADTAVAVATVVAYGTLACLLYPLLFVWLDGTGWYARGALSYGLQVGSTVHEVAQVMVAGNVAGAEAARIAIVSKMLRVLLLAPFLLALAWYIQRTSSGETQQRPLQIPWFALAFVLVAAINSLGWFAEPLRVLLMQLGDLLLAIAMVALGLTTRLSDLRMAGMRPMLLAGVLALWLLTAGLLTAHWL